ncbi:hypothetical protein ACFU7T_32940 [Streptomyces sp. NPDC057555]|uniref:hypothetical protein n=1 Tax=Streptomyces sp. NPDC057555 TaxID=3346166 RepID=UPI0036957B3D
MGLTPAAVLGYGPDGLRGSAVVWLCSRRSGFVAGTAVPVRRFHRIGPSVAMNSVWRPSGHALSRIGR